MSVMIEALAGRRVALAHHWMLSMRGGEKVLEAIARLVPDAPIFTLLADPPALSAALREQHIRTSFLQELPAAKRIHRYLLPLFPLAAESLDCTGFDVVICSDAAVAKGVRCRDDALKICYCHSPMRYAWGLQAEYVRNLSPAAGLGLALSARYLRRWDCRAARRVDAFVANSHHVRRRIDRHYGRASTVIHPPVGVPAELPPRRPEDFYLVLAEQVEYKRTDLAIAACNRLGRRLKVIGDGPLRQRMARAAGASVEVLGWQPDQVVREHFARCRALLFCGEEDFGLVPVEAMGWGVPVIAYSGGGALETVADGQTGVLFARQTVPDVIAAIGRFESMESQFDARFIHQHARRFSPGRFVEQFQRFVTLCLEVYARGGRHAVRRQVQGADRPVEC